MNAILKTELNISVLTFLLVAASSQCFAEMVGQDVSKERAKELGVAIRSRMANTNEVQVWLEFTTKGELKDFTYAQLGIMAGERSVLSATLLPKHPSPDIVLIFFSADPATMPTCIVTIVVGEFLSMTGYRFKLKDFVEVHQTPQSNLATDTNTVGNAGPSHSSPPASPVKPAKAGSGADILRAVGGELLPEDSLSADYWQSLDPKSKTVFLTAYRHGQGPSEDHAAKPEFRFLSTDHFATLIAKLDKFYQIPENRHVFLSAAIQICFMEMAGKPQANIDQAIKQARKAFSRL